MLIKIIDMNGSVERTMEKLEGAGNAAINTENVMWNILFNMLVTERTLIDSEGRRGGGSWPRLKPSTVIKKGNSTLIRTLGAKPNYSKINGRTSVDTLFKSLTVLDAPYQVNKVSDTEVILGTTRPAAEAIDARRPLFKFTPADWNRWNKMIERHIMQGFARQNKGQG